MHNTFNKNLPMQIINKFECKINVYIRIKCIYSIHKQINQTINYKQLWDVKKIIYNLK